MTWDSRTCEACGEPWLSGVGNLTIPFVKGHPQLCAKCVNRFKKVMREFFAHAKNCVVDQ